METIEILLKCVVVGNTVKLPNIQLDPKTEYQSLKKVLELAGGRWNTKAAGFVFEEDPTELLAALQRGEKLNPKKEFQFFATPTNLANYLVSIAYDVHLKGAFEFGGNPKILEPSAGDGAIVKAIVKHFPDQRVDCFELMEQNRIKLQQLTGADIQGNDFLDAVTQDTMNMYREQYDLVIANPPFRNGQDIDHIRAMYKCLKPGGLVVTLSSPSWTFQENKKAQDFREWLAELNADKEEVPSGTFKESGTGVATYIITIKKPNNEMIIEPKKEEVKTETIEVKLHPSIQEPEVYLDQMITSNNEIAKDLLELKHLLNPQEMDFFKQISELMGQSEVNITLKAKGPNITVMVIHKSSGIQVPPLTITGTPEDLDEGFFKEISKPVARMSGLVSNAAEVEKALDGITAAAPAATESTDAPTAPVKKSRSKAKAEPAPTDPEEPKQDEGQPELEAPGISAEEQAKIDEEARLQAIADEEAEKERVRLEEEKAAESLRIENLNAIIIDANTLAEAKEFRPAAFKLKEAKAFSPEDGHEALTSQIKEWLQKAAELEFESM
jgi:PRTRC genetic system protein E